MTGGGALERLVRYNLEVIEEQFGPIIRGIVEERLLLERLPEPTSAQSYVVIRQVTCSIARASPVCYV